jgi:hypothetical protein
MVLSNSNCLPSHLTDCAFRSVHLSMSVRALEHVRALEPVRGAKEGGVPLVRVCVAVARQVAGAGMVVLAFATLLLLAGPKAAEAAAAPSAYTGEASELTSTSATLKGSIGPGNEETSYYFEYGTTAGYGAQTPTTPAGAGTQAIHVSAPLTGLAADTTYHYRLVAVNARGTRDGQERLFATKKVPLTFTLAAASGRHLPGTPFPLSGTLAGTGSIGRAVVLEANPFPYLSGFKAIVTPVLTDALGNFSFSVPGLSQNTQLRVATVETPPINSRAVIERVAVRVALHVRPSGHRGYVRLYGAVTPGQVGALVGFQLLRPGRKPLTVASAIITDRANKAFSRFSRVVRIRHAGLYRAYVRVVSGAQVSNGSRAIRIG